MIGTDNLDLWLDVLHLVFTDRPSGVEELSTYGPKWWRPTQRAGK
jgi:hypothetical protein